MTEAAAHSWWMLGRQARNLAREPIWIVLMLVQPMFWLLLYSQLFQRVTDLPGFETDSYTDFFVPAVVVMTAFFNGTWSGMAMITDLDRGVIERFLVVGLFLGATNGGPLGWAVILVAAALIGGGFAGISHGIALLTRKEATMIALANFIGLPLLFLSAMLIDSDLMPRWMQIGAWFNTVDWAVRAAREAALPGTDWANVGLLLALLAAFTALTGAFATWAFRAYQRTL